MIVFLKPHGGVATIVTGGEVYDLTYPPWPRHPPVLPTLAVGDRVRAYLMSAAYIATTKGNHVSMASVP